LLTLAYKKSNINKEDIISIIIFLFIIWKGYKGAIVIDEWKHPKIHWSCYTLDGRLE
jgi:hypothetical protein